MGRVKRDIMLKNKKISFMASGLCWLWVSVVVVMLDHLTKWAAKKSLTLYSSYAVMPGFNFSLSFNKGAAFGFWAQFLS